jgi:hypothetical protein
VIHDWRAGTHPGLQRQAGGFRPWLCSEVAMVPCIWRELERRARAEGADVFEDDQDDDEDLEDDDLDDDHRASVRRRA